MAESGSKKGWTRVAFGDVVRLSRERSNDPAVDGLNRYVGLDHLDPDDLRIRRWGNVATGTTFTNVFRAGQVLFGKRRAYQRKLAVADFDGVCSGDIYVFEPSNGHLLPELLPFICQTDGFFDHAVRTSAGSLSPRTNWDSLAQYELTLPNVEEQRRIASALTSAQAVSVAYQDARIACDGLVVTASDHLFGALLRDPRIPTRRLDELVVGGVSNGIFRTREQFGSGLRLINVTDCYRDFRVPLNSLKRVPVLDNEYSSFSAAPGDVIFNRSSLVLAGIGHACLVPDSNERLVFECHLMRVRPDSQRLLGAFLARYALSPFGRKYILSRAQTTTMTTIAQGDLRDMPVPCPDLATQHRIADQLDAIENSSSIIRARLGDVAELGRTMFTAMWTM